MLADLEQSQMQCRRDRQDASKLMVILPSGDFSSLNDILRSFRIIDNL